jgi:predicted O-methyltransferase YrrM
MRLPWSRRARLTATPNPVRGADPTATATIGWTTGDGTVGQVFVSAHGAPEQLFATGAFGTRKTRAIAAGVEYEFRLYGGLQKDMLIESVTVRREPTSWEAIASALLDYATQEADHRDIAELLSIVVPRFLAPSDRAMFFHLCEARGFHVTPVHYYYPIPDTRALPAHIWTDNPVSPGIDMNDRVQLDLLVRCFPVFRAEYDQFRMGPSESEDEFYFDNPWFGGTDALVLYCMIRHFRPRLVIEVGSGFSTRVSLHAARQNGDTRLVCIEPYPDDPVRHSLLQGDHYGIVSLIEQKVEDVPFDQFDQLHSGDILFIDSSHISRIGGDVNRLILDILPRINPGVIVHFHDIFLPWEYPREWVVEKLRFFTEQYLLQAFLTLNPHYSVLMANHYLGRKYPRELRATFPTSPWWGGESFWIQRSATRPSR